MPVTVNWHRGQTDILLNDRRQDAPFALPTPPSASSDPLSRFLPRYSTATFAFVPLAGGGHKSEIVSEDENESVTGYSTPMDVSEATRSPSSASLPSSWPSDYDWTLEQFLEISAQRRHAQPKKEDTRSLSSHYMLPDPDDSPDSADGPGSSQAQETELLARQGAGRLCVLVVAPPHRIALALSSAVYHRLACGISQPVLGLVVSQEHPTVQLALAWTEHTGVLTDDLVSSSRDLTMIQTELPCSLGSISRWTPPSRLSRLMLAA